MVQTPTRLDAEQEELLRRLATARGEERPEGRVANPGRGLDLRQAARRVQGALTARMTLPLHLLAPEALAGRGVGDVVVLDGPEGRHAATVRRTRVGEHLLLTDGAGLRVEGEVVAVGRGHARPARSSPWPRDPEPSPRFVLVQALAKNDRDDQAVEAATECGVDEVVPWQASRSVVQWRGERGEKARRKWDAVLVAATKQSRRTRRPVLAPTATTADLVAARVARRGGRLRAARGRHRCRWPTVDAPGGR